MSSNGYAQYQQNNILTASPSKLLIMAYDGAIKFSRVAGEKMKENNLNEQSININKAIAIVMELVSTLKEEVDPLLVNRLRSLYAYVVEKLGMANLEQDQAALAEAINILSELREAWAECDRKMQAEAQAQQQVAA
ncbi:MAG: flagellar export chaperone FliS [Armatimonadetes bacterium]|nr:flagellar export chaperone FliS [Armatimonadota bacterium]